MKTCLCLLLFLSFPFSASANGIAMTTGNDATGGLIFTDSKLRVLDEHPTVSIQREDLHVRLYSRHAEVDLTYKFRNDGRKTKATMGFPSIATTSTFFQEQSAPPPPKSGTKLPGPPQDLSDYKISLNGQPLSWQLYAVGTPGDADAFAPPNQWNRMYHSTQWLVSELPFAANSEGAVHITYRCPYESTTSAGERTSDSVFAYKLSTGRNWHGPIHEGKVEIECVEVPAKYVSITPDRRFKRVGSSFTWEFADLKPGTEDDIKVIADPGHQGGWGDYVHGDYRLYDDHWYYSPVPCTAEASSELKEGDRHFAARNLVNGKGSCWIEGVESDGIGESVTLTLKKPCRIDGFKIANGFCQNGGSDRELKTLYETNGRVSELEVKVDDQPPFKVAIPDSQQQFFVVFPSETMAHKVKLTIAGVYPGTKYHDTCIGEVRLRQVLTKKPADEQSR